MHDKQNTACPSLRETPISILSSSVPGEDAEAQRVERETPPKLLDVTVRMKLLMVTVVIHIYRAPSVCSVLC